MSTSTKTPTVTTPPYENNPFFVAVNGLELLFNKARAIGIVLAVIAAISALGSLPSAFVPPAEEPSPTVSQEEQEAQWAREEQQFVDGITSIPFEIWFLIGAFILTVLLILIVIGIVIRGVSDYTSAQLAKDKEVGLSEALRVVFANFWGYTWVLFIAGVKTFLWTLLFIIPGIIMSVRYSLAGVVYFDKKLRGDGAVKESARLTRDGWFTTFASQSLFNLVTLSAIAPLLVPGTQAVLYRQFGAYDAAGIAKPSAHILSWLTLIVPLLLGLTLFVLIGFIAAAFSQM